VLQVHDAGTATIDPYADLRPCAGGTHGGYGLWTVGQLAAAVHIATGAHGNTVTTQLAALDEPNSHRRDDVRSTAAFAKAKPGRIVD
jgi:hypothetical protein